MRKFLSIVGARPQFIKAGIISKKLRRKEWVREILVHTGQHYDFNMSDVFFQELSIPTPDYYLGVGSGSHGEQTGRMLIEIEKVILKEKPSGVIVYGDTNSTLAGALAAAKLHIPLAHVEAGLRSYNKLMPEEINRVLTDHLSAYLFAPTRTAVENLKKEGIAQGVYLVGDVMYDVALEAIQKVDEIRILNQYQLSSKAYILVTIHRAENTDNWEHFSQIWKALHQIANQGIRLFFPVHPRTKKLIEKNSLQVMSKNLSLSDPVSYLEMLALEKHAKVIITDSGGVQKEGYFWGTPCVIPRKETEWVELIEAGWNHLVGLDTDELVKRTIILFFDTKNSKKDRIENLYGDGCSSDKIIQILLTNIKG